MSNLNKLSKMFADRSNPFQINITLGEVISVNPVIKVKYGDKIILDNTQLIIASGVLSMTLNIGDKVILVPDNAFNQWYLIDKAVRQ